MKMKFESRTSRESLEKSIARIASAYGFTSPAVSVSKRSVQDQSDTLDYDTRVTAAFLNTVGPQKKTVQAWGAAKKGGATTFTFTVLASRHAISHALVIKAAVSVLERAGFSDIVVGVSSVGDVESKRRFVRELQSYFRKHGALIDPAVLKHSHTDPEGAYRDILVTGGEAAEKLPRPIDFLSENSRKTMVDTLHLFESVGIEYELQAHLPSAKGVHAELLFAISARDQKGAQSIAATGGRIDDLMKKSGPTIGHSVALSVTIPESVEVSESTSGLSCFVVHVGEAAKLKSFSMIDALWRADIAVRQALLSESLKEQMDSAKAVGAKYVAIVGQREALDGTVLLRNFESGLQQSLVRDKLASFLNAKSR